MRDVQDRARSLRWTAYTAGASFIVMLFNLIALGVPWYYKPGCDTTLLYCVSRNSGFTKSAGDPGFAFLFLGGLFHFFAVFALYARWGGRTSWVPHSALACVVFFAVATLCFFLSVTIYGGVMNTTKGKPRGGYGSGFGLAIWILLVEFFSTIALWLYRKEIDEKDGGAGPAVGGTTGDALPAPVNVDGSRTPDPGQAYTEQTINATRFNVSQIANVWSKAKAHSTVIFLAIFSLLFVIMSLGLPWYNVHSIGSGENATHAVSAGLVQSFVRLPSEGDLAPARKAGDPAFAFTFLGFLAQIYVTMAVTLRFLGRNDGFYARIPHSLAACVIGNCVTWLCAFFAFVIYAGVFNTKEKKDLLGQFGGGFGLIVINWLLVTSVILVLIFKRKEVQEAHATPQAPTTPFPQANPLPGAGAPAPAIPMYPAATAMPTYPQSYPAEGSFGYTSSYTEESLDAAAPAPAGGTNPFDNKGYAASPSGAIV